jgi:large subunit ribosomal protein L25
MVRQLETTMAIEVNATKRDTQGRGASRRLRRAGQVPGIVYGAGKDAEPILVDHQELSLALRKETFHASILTLNLDGQKQQVLLRDYQVHPWRDLVWHVDFQRIAKDRKIHMKVPLHFINAEVAPGVKTSGGSVQHIISELEIICLPDDLPEFVEVDLSDLQLGHSIHLSELKLPKGVESVQLRSGDDAVVASIPVPRVEAAPEEAEAAVAPAAAGAAPAAAPAAVEKKPAGGEKKEEKK